VRTCSSFSGFFLTLSTTPRASVFTSFHSPITNWISAPSRLSSWTAGPAGLSGRSRSKASTSAACTCICAAPACSVICRTLASATATPKKNASSRCAARNGIHVPKRAIPSSTFGVNPTLGRNLNCSSRGKKAYLTTGAVAIAAL
jgi:hypothetical protein